MKNFAGLPCCFSAQLPILTHCGSENRIRKFMDRKGNLGKVWYAPVEGTSPVQPEG